MNVSGTTSTNRITISTICTMSIISTISTISTCTITATSRVPLEGKSSVCLICMKYRIIFVIIIIISLGQMLSSYIANTSRTHARTHERTHAHACARTRANACIPSTHTAVAVSLFDGSVPANRDGPLCW